MKTISKNRRVAESGPSSYSLPFEANPAYKAYLDTAFALGILGTDIDARNLLSLYYLNLAAPAAHAAKKPGECQLYIMPWNTLNRFCMFGLLREERPSFDLPHGDTPAISEWILDMLSRGGYVYATVNDYFIPGTRSHASRVAYTHPCLITACDAEKQIFTVYTYLSNGMYGSASVPYADWTRAFTQRGDVNLMPETHFYEPVLYGILRSSTPFGLTLFDRLGVANALSNYVNCRFDRYATYEQEDYGLDAVGTFIERTASAVALGEAVDLRGTRTLMEHRRILTIVLDHARDQLSLDNIDRIERAFKALESWASSLHSLAHDYEQGRNSAMKRVRGQVLLQHMRDAGRMTRMDKRASIDFIDALLPRGMRQGSGEGDQASIGRVWHHTG